MTTEPNPSRNTQVGEEDNDEQDSLREDELLHEDYLPFDKCEDTSEQGYIYLTKDLDDLLIDKHIEAREDAESEIKDLIGERIVVGKTSWVHVLEINKDYVKEEYYPCTGLRGNNVLNGINELPLHPFETKKDNRKKRGYHTPPKEEQVKNKQQCDLHKTAFKILLNLYPGSVEENLARLNQALLDENKGKRTRSYKKKRRKNHFT
jgi:hypothetical protein